ncbi:ISL3 family transposase [Streptomyces sp. NBC_00210]|uniref:ISL3 family transposase n=1 Tax=Streptomyces sp. NBC_00210 TaxID=2903636 RepID=UPI003245855B
MIKAVDEVLFPGVSVQVSGIQSSRDELVVEVASTGRPGRCPDCLRRAKRVHSLYQRRLAERPVGSRQVVVRLTVRRFFCDGKSCPRKTFAEQVGGLTERYCRSSVGLKSWLKAIAEQSGGRAGERLCRQLRLAAGRTRLLGLLEAPLVPERAPRVLGVDEFAFRKGRTYGTILVDVETARVVDVLPDRTSETFSAWLREHPGAEIICRDRASTYSRAVKEAAPQATEVADRWHLLQNLSRAVEKTCHQHRPCLRKYAEEVAGDPPRMPLLDALPPTLIIDRVRRRYEEVNRLVDTGYPLSEVARRLGLDRKTARRYRDTDLETLIASARDRRNSPLDRFKPFLQAQYAAGNTNAAELYQQIVDRGFRGGYSTLTRYVLSLRKNVAVPAPAHIPNPRTITGLIMRARDQLSTRETAQLEQVRLACPDITNACDLARVFTDLVRHRRGNMLGEWIRHAEKSDLPPLRSFAGSLRQDFDAVTAGLTLRWSSGVVEGHVCRVKLLKRSMYGRASFTLLRTRILTSP